MTEGGRPAGRKPKVVVIDDWDGQARSSPSLNDLATDVELAIYDDTTDLSGLIRRLDDAEIVIPIRERTQFDAQLLNALPKLKLLAQTGGGAAHVDIESARRLGIKIALTPGASARAVAELCLGLMLALYRHIGEGNRLLRDHTWHQLLGRELPGRTLGIVGLGHTGRAFADLASRLGMKVIAWSRSLVPPRARGYIDVVGSLDELVTLAECVSLHLSLTAETEGIINYPRLSRMREGSLLINTARGELIVEEDLIRVLQNGPIAAAALDVFAHEPLPMNSRLLSFDNVLLTPHLGWRTQETMERYFCGASENVRAYLRGDLHDFITP